MKALALIRLGKSEEAETILNEVKEEEPFDDATLQAMAICYRETHRRKSPDNLRCKQSSGKGYPFCQMAVTYSNLFQIWLWF